MNASETEKKYASSYWWIAPSIRSIFTLNNEKKNKKKKKKKTDDALLLRREKEEEEEVLVVVISSYLKRREKLSLFFLSKELCIYRRKHLIFMRLSLSFSRKAPKKKKNGLKP